MTSGTRNGRDVFQQFSGYLHENYARAFGAFGEPTELPRCHGWLLQRKIGRGDRRDAMGCYPIFCCKDWSGLVEDVASLCNSGLVSVSIVTDPFGDFTEGLLQQCVPDRMIPFKQHYVVDLCGDWEASISSHHVRNVRNAKRDLVVEQIKIPKAFLDTWVDLYANLVNRHNIRGIARFSQESFEAQMAVPGLEAFRAVSGEETVGMVLWMVQEGIAYYHLGAYSDLGYEKRASYAIFYASLQAFAGRGLAWASLGAGAGVASDCQDGLTRFKRGWASGTRIAFFCGRILDDQKYRQIVRASDTGGTRFFPAYRSGEYSR